MSDLYRYAAAGEHQFTGGQPAYFSIDGGQSSLGRYATSFDYTLFSDKPGDPFQADQTQGTSTTLTGLDIEVMHLLGFGSQPVPVGYSLPATGGPVDIAGFGSPNILGAQVAAGTGRILVDLRDGYVTRGSTFDATISNIQGVQLGADDSVVLGLGSGTALIYGGTGPMAFYGEGSNDFVQGGTGPNTIVGGTGSEVFYSDGGQDTMRGGAGSNFMQAGSSPGSVDTFFGSGGADYVYGGAGTTALVGGTGYEQLTGSTTSTGLDALYGGSGTDGGAGTNLFYEGSDKDVFAGTSGTDLIYGGTGESAVFAGAGTTAVSTGAGNQYVQTGSGHLFFNDTAAGLHAGRYDQIDNFSGGGGVDVYLPTAVQGATGFVAQSGGTAVVTAVDGGTATLFAPGADLATVQAHTHFTL